MKKINLTIVALTALFTYSANAQTSFVTSADADNNDTNTFDQAMQVEVDELFILDVTDGLNNEVTNVKLDMGDVTQEAGTYDFASVVTDPMYLQYSSVVPSTGGTRTVDVGFVANSGNIPDNTELVIKFANGIQDAGDQAGNIGTVAGANQVVLEHNNNTAETLINSIGSAVTGSTGVAGLEMTYELQEAAGFDFGNYTAQTYNGTLRYTISSI